MCQLLYVNLHGEKYNHLATYVGLLRDSVFNHKDGWGIFTERYGTPVKCKGALLDTIGLHNFPELFDERPVIGHVRKASVHKDIKDSNFNHPFSSDKYILAHNGTLSDGSTIPVDKIDTQIFLEKLLEESESKKEFPDIFNNTMEKFWGKFAFLIRDLTSKNNYIIRGTKAELHKVDFLINDTFAGYIVNTEKTCLSDIANQLRILFLTIDPSLKYDFDNLEELEKNSIYLAKDDSVEKIADANEQTEEDLFPEKVKKANRGIYSSPAHSQYGFANCWGDDWQSDYWERGSRKNSWETEDLSLSIKMQKLMTYLTVQELDEILALIYNTGILGINLEQLEDFENTYLKRLVSHCDVNKFKVWSSATLSPTHEKTLWGLYKDGNLQFPHFMQKKQELQVALEKIL